MATAPKTSTLKRKRTAAVINYVYNEKMSKFQDYEVKFLKKPIVIRFQDVVKVVRCDTNKNIRLGICELSAVDKEELIKHMAGMKETFPLGGHGTLTKSLMPSEGLMFLNADPKTCAMYDTNKKIANLNTLTQVSTCHLAVLLLGMKRSKDEVSYMARVHQLLQVPEPEQDENEEEEEDPFNTILF